MYECVFSVNTMVTLDSNWRWIHDSGYTNCYTGKVSNRPLIGQSQHNAPLIGHNITGNEWDNSLCPDAASCADNCYLEGVNSDQVSSYWSILASKWSNIPQLVF